MKAQITCPQCHKAAVWQENPHRPFCSERCQLIDLGQWADGSYCIPEPSQASSSDDDIIQIQSKEQHTEG